ncbi:MAG: glycosyltransferase family 39 protein [bacterium]|nr:glycosyltransferase family 39 protein [bacterium]
MKERLNSLICMQSRRKAVLFIFITALLFRLIGLFFVDIHNLEYGDMAYQTIVDNLLDGKGYLEGEFRAFRPPLFPLIHAGILAVFGRDNILALRLFFIMIGSITCVGLYLIARDIFRLKLAVLTGLLLALSPQHIWYSIHILSECPYTLFLVFLVYFLLKAVQKSKLVFSYAAGILLGLSLLTRSILAGFLPFYLLWMLVVYKSKLSAIRHFAVLLIFALTTVPL